MSEELKPQVGAGAGAEAPPATSEGAATTETTTGIAPEMQQAIDTAIARIKQEYEGKGGHIAKLKSSYDTQIAQLKRQLQERTKSEYQEAVQLMEAGDYEEAARQLAAQAQVYQQQQEQDAQVGALADWARSILGGLGYDLESDQEAAEYATEWLEKIQNNRDYAWEFIMDASQKKLGAERQKAETAQKELAKVQEGIPTLVKAEVAKALTEAGLTPTPTPEGGTPPTEEDWRKMSTGKLIQQGLAQRARAPVNKTT